MTIFWLVAALFVAGALLMLLPPLLAPTAPAVTLAGASGAVQRRQWQEVDDDVAAGLLAPERAAQARADLERRAMEDAAAATPIVLRPARRTALVVALLLPLVSLGVYGLLGSPRLAAPATEAPAPGPGERHALGKPQLEQMAATLAERLQARPDDADGWLMLGRSYTVLGRYRDGATALRRASELRPDDPAILADLADLTGMAQGKRLAGEPARLVQRALDLDPRHPKALALAGSVAFEARDWGAARGYWERLLAVLPADSDMARSIQGSIAETRQMEGGAAPVAAAAAVLTGEVSLSPELAARLQPGDTLFVFARAAEGPRMPLAVLRRPAGAAPFAFRLDDSMGMAGGPKLSGATSVIVGARLSRSGNATPQSGDLVGSSAPLDPRSQGVRIVIDQVQP